VTPEFPMTLPSFMKHVRTLETNGLISTVKSGRVRTCTLSRDRLALVDDWLAEQRRIWEGSSSSTTSSGSCSRTRSTAPGAPRVRRRSP
jgi:DNA-binding transcriptional ArsR family regulator